MKTDDALGGALVFGFSRDIGIDLGTASILIYVKGKGIVLKEPSVVAIERDTKKILAIGSEAQRMLGRTPGNIVAIRPLRDGVIADYDVTKAMMEYFIKQVLGSRWLGKPRMMVCIPAGVTTVEKRAVIEAAMEAGARSASLIEEPLAAALGAGLDISKPNGHMVVDIGGGTTDIAVLSLGGVVQSQSIRIGGDRFDEAIVRSMKKGHNLLIGERTAEEIKITVATAAEGLRDLEMDVRGRDLMSGLPKNVRVSSREMAEALAEQVSQICETVKWVLEHTPPELTADIIDKGIVMTGGGAMLHGLDQVITRHTGVPAYLADDPISCVVKGTGKALEQYQTNEDHLVVLKRVM